VVLCTQLHLKTVQHGFCQVLELELAIVHPSNSRIKILAILVMESFGAGIFNQIIWCQLLVLQAIIFFCGGGWNVDW